MDARTFFDKVSEMRKYQKEYFKARKMRSAKSVCDRWLDLSCRAEQEIDAEIDRVNKLLQIKDPQSPVQSTLNFDNC